jgi:AcrR family transcriptional regulator
LWEQSGPLKTYESLKQFIETTMSRTDQRKQRILAAAIAEAKQHGYSNVTRDAIAQRADCAAGLVSFYFGTMPQMKRTIMSEAIRTRELRIVAQGIADGHPKAKRAPLELRRAAIATLM